VGDACVDDYDGDGVPDVDDACPHVKHISKTSFLDYFTVDLYPGHSDPKPEWRVAKMVKRAKLKWASKKKLITLSIVHKVKTRKITTVKRFGHPVLISMDLDDFTSLFTP